MTTRRRLDQVEGALAPLEVVLQWLEEAHAYPTFTDYMTYLVDRPKSSYPSVRLPLRVADSVEAALHGASREYVTRVAMHSMMATASLVLLVGVINAAVEEVLRFEGLRALALSWWHRALRLEQVARDEEALGPGHTSVDDWSDWHRVAAAHQHELLRVETARRAAEERNLGGRCCLFPGLETEWARFLGTAGLSVGGERAQGDDIDREAGDLLTGWELQAFTEVLRNLGAHGAAMSLTDHQLRQALEVDAAATNDHHHDQGDR